MNSQNTVMKLKSQRRFQSFTRMALSAPGKLLLAMTVLFGLASLPLVTQADQASGENKLTGNWLVTVTPVTSPPTPSFLSLVTYFEDGNLLQEGTSNILRSTGRGNWERTGHRRFTQSIILFRFDAARTYIGTRVITSTIRLSKDGSEYQADSVGQNFDTSGNLLTTSQVTEVAQRLF